MSHKTFDFYRTVMPKTRLAGYYLSCLNSSVFIDFDCTSEQRITLVRISFDGYGCCGLKKAKTLNAEDSMEFTEEIEKEELDQVAIERLVKKIIWINRDQVWNDALEQYGLLEKSE